MTCNNQKKCGCKDTPFTTQYLCGNNTQSCTTPEPCPETFSSDCIIYMGDSIVDLNINKGDRFTQIIQKLALFAIMPDCFETGTGCVSVTNLHSASITTTTVALEWTLQGTPDNVQLEYKKATEVIWTQSALLANTTTGLTLSNLDTDTLYHIRVGSICSAETCYSLTIEIQTLQ